MVIGYDKLPLSLNDSRKSKLLVIGERFPRIELYIYQINQNIFDISKFISYLSVLCLFPKIKLRRYHAIFPKIKVYTCGVHTDEYIRTDGTFFWYFQASNPPLRRIVRNVSAAMCIYVMRYETIRFYSYFFKYYLLNIGFIYENNIMTMNS